MESPTPPRLHVPSNQCISAETIHLIDTSVDLHLITDYNRNQARTLTRAVQRSLFTYFHCQMEAASKEISTCLETPQYQPTDLKGSYAILKRWYCHTSTRQPKPSRAYLAKVSGENSEIYQREYPYLDQFPLHARLLLMPTWCHSQYLQGRQNLPLYILQMGPLRLVKSKFQELKAMKTPTPPRFHVPSPQWISAETIHLIDTRVALHLIPDHNRNQARTLTRAVQRSLLTYFHCKMEAAAKDIST